VHKCNPVESVRSVRTVQLVLNVHIAERGKTNFEAGMKD